MQGNASDHEVLSFRDTAVTIEPEPDEEDHGGGHMMMNWPKPGRYLGHIEMENSKKLAVSFDLFKVQEGADWRKLKGILKVFLGDFNSKEYITHTFDSVLLITNPLLVNTH